MKTVESITFITTSQVTSSELEKLIAEYVKNNPNPTKNEAALLKLIRVLYEHHYREENIVTDNKILAKVWGAIFVGVSFIAVAGLLGYFSIMFVMLPLTNLIASSSIDAKFNLITTVLVAVASSAVTYFFGQWKKTKTVKKH